MTRVFTKKRASIALFFFLTACSQSQPQWQSRQTVTHCKAYNSKKVLFPAENRFRGIELEIATTASGQRMYANVFSIPFTSESDLPDKTKMTIQIEDDSFETLADRFEGGQRLLIPDDAASKIITALQEDQSVRLNAGRYSANISPRKFKKI